MGEITGTGKEHDRKQKGRFMGKLFIKEPKKSTSEVEVEEFLHGSSNKFFTIPTNLPNPQPFSRLHAPYPQTIPTELESNYSSLAVAPQTTPKRSKKDLVVHFSDAQPELIGEGGDLAESPVIKISSWKKAGVNPLLQSQITQSPSDKQAAIKTLNESPQRLYPEISPLKSKSNDDLNKENWTNIEERGDHTSYKITSQISGNLNEKRKDDGKHSISQRVKDEMRSSEGMTLVASRNSILEGDLSESLAIEGTSSQLEELHLNTISNAIRSNSSRSFASNEPLAIENLIDNSISIAKSSTPKEISQLYFQELQSKTETTDPQIAMHNLPNFTIPLEEEALNEFVKRTSHLSNTFRASAEALKPLKSCSLELLVRAGLWWFLKGRMNLENAVRDRSGGNHGQVTNLCSLYQAYTDLAKTLWILEIVRLKYADTEFASVADNISSDVLDTRASLLSGMKKLAVSLKRNNFLPPSSFKSPETQNLDLTIWILEDGDNSLIYGQIFPPAPSISGSLPLGDTNNSFHYARIFAEAILTEEGTDQRYRSHVVLSIIRNQKDKLIQAIVVNQDGSLNFVIQSDKSRGPNWQDLKWYVRKAVIEIQLRRGFFLHIQCSQLDFATIWKLHDYEKRTYGALSQRTGEELIFETKLKNLQYLDESSRSTLNNEPQPNCHMRLFEKTHTMSAATGPRTMHRGFRISVVTSPSTKYLRAIELELSTSYPIEFSFLRGEGKLPAILLKSGGKFPKNMLIATFSEPSERARFHSFLTDVALGSNEEVIAKGGLSAFAFSTVNQNVIQLSQALDLQGFKFINQKHNNLQGCKTLLSEKLRMTIEFRYGTITDRVNVGPGELKLHLDPRHPCQLRVLRQPQEDWTILIESQAPQGSLQELEGLMAMSKGFELVRAYTFPSINELHLFQMALTGFQVIFDEVVTSLNISRRRMVVPIYKKWDANMPRLLIVKKEKIIQLVAFFENFSHGDCMNFILRSTDIFEISSRSGKYSLRIVDAKFALPKLRTGETTLDHEFVCLDMPDYPGEHDDISIHFDNEGALERFMKSLPAQVRHTSRIGTVRR
ncbi:hypothetical protein OnM2_076029 [Erysiphe neolycopersici]|uniref:Uncharacterized protein n=1 Tax=Erysiphe neolycopersici TaxID=212602 RepID=A0A420HIE9_9PEZI|nr:hypothetical protein OnM2_076029 [Erysiphe neolycopersici]